MNDMKHIKEYLFLAMFAVSSTANAVVIRHDIEDEKYQVAASALPALAAWRLDFSSMGCYSRACGLHAAPHPRDHY